MEQCTTQKLKEFFEAGISFCDKNSNPNVKKELGIMRLNINEFGKIFLSFFGDYESKQEDYIILYHKTYQSLFDEIPLLEELFTFIPPKYHKVILQHFTSFDDSLNIMTQIIKNDWTLSELKKQFAK